MSMSMQEEFSGMSGLVGFVGIIMSTVMVAAMAVHYLYVLWRSSTERLTKVTVSTSKLGERVLLPSPPKVLPDCFGVISGHMLALEEDKMIQQFEGWADKFGGDFELRLLGRRCIVVTGAKDIRRMLTLRPTKFKRGWTESHLQWSAKEIGISASLFFEEGRQWGRSRRLIAPPLNAHNMAGLLPSIGTVLDGLCCKLEKKAETGVEVDMKDAIARFAHDVIAVTAFGLKTNAVTKELGESCPSFDAMNNILGTMMEIATEPAKQFGWVYLSKILPWVKKAKRQSDVLRDVVQDTVDSTRETMKSGGGDCNGMENSTTAISAAGSLLRKAISSSSGTERGGTSEGNGLSKRMTLSDDEVLQQVKSLFIAGTDTTALSTCWALYFLTKRPELHARCRKEALEVAPESEGRVSTAEQLSKLVFCAAVYKETLRVKTSATLLFLHCAEDYTMKSGVVAEKGTAITVLNRYASLNEDAFTRPRDFVPERWIDAEREKALLGEGGGTGNSTNVINHAEDSWMPFGSGPRVCPGQDLAKTEGAILIAAVCARFDLALAPGQADPPPEIMRFLSGPEDLKLVFTRRKA